jgi:hypothetical protein
MFDPFEGSNDTAVAAMKRLNGSTYLSVLILRRYMEA